MIVSIKVPVQVDLKDLFQMSPGDNCPDEECLGVITSITMEWDREHISGEAYCGYCSDRWTLIEVPSYGDIHEQEKQEGETPGHLRPGPKPAVLGEVQDSVYNDTDDESGGEDHH